MHTIVFDCDGVLVDFCAGFVAYGTRLFGTPLPDASDLNNPRYGTEHIVGPATSRVIWDAIVKDTFFWEGLPASASRRDFERINALSDTHAVYFATNRPGIHSKAQTE